MPVASSPSDYTAINVDYSTGQGFYTDKNAVSDMLQIPAFSSSTYPTQAQIGSIIKNIEGIVDDKVKRSYRPIIYENEFHNFEFIRHPMQSYYGGYVGFIQLDVLKLRKVISLQVWQGNQYQELASAQASISLNSTGYNNLRSITLQLPNSGDSWVLYHHAEGSLAAHNTFHNGFGSKTTAQEICHLINEEYPARTAQFTGATRDKVLTSSDKAGQDSSTTSTAFTDMQDMKRLGSFWSIGDEGRIFFLRDYPYHTQNSIIVTYIAGSGRVPSAIHKATTMLVAAEIIRHDDQSILIAETGSNISTKEKYDILVKEANDILSGKGDMVFLLD